MYPDQKMAAVLLSIHLSIVHFNLDDSFMYSFHHFGKRGWRVYHFQIQVDESPY